MRSSRSALGVLLCVMTMIVSAGPVRAGTATISGVFTDGCRDFVAHSTKDISHVVIHYADGRVVKDETIETHDYAVDGGAGDEIGSVVVKSGTTRAPFDCSASSPPTALLEAQMLTGEGAGGWTSDDDPRCPYPFACWETSPEANGKVLIPFRGINSADPDNDIVSWSIDFGDGTSTGLRSWASDPPSSVEHAYSGARDGGYQVVLTVTDSEGNSASDTMTVVFDTDHED